MLSSVSEKGAGGDDGGKEDCESRRAGVGRGMGDDPRGGERARLLPLGVWLDCAMKFLMMHMVFDTIFTCHIFLSR